MNFTTGLDESYPENQEKGVVILPKKIREKVGLNEGDAILVETRGEEIVFRPLKPIIVDVQEEVVDELLEEESKLT